MIGHRAARQARVLAINAAAYWRALEVNAWRNLEDGIAELRAAIGPTPRAVYLQADICRRDLAVEIEATAMVAPRAGA